MLSYEDGIYYVQYGDDESTKKALTVKSTQSISMIIPGWTPGGVINTSAGSDSSRAIMTITNTPSNGWAECTSPAFDFTDFDTLQLAGSAYKYINNSGDYYSPRIFLLNADGTQVASLYVHGGGAGVTESINKVIDVSKYSGKYMLQFAIYSSTGAQNNGAYIRLEKALLSN